MLLRRCCCCCSCAAWTEAWAYTAGPVPDPPWAALFGPGSELVANGAGGATSGAGPGLGVRTLADGTHLVAFTLTVDDPTVSGSLSVTDAGFVPALAVGYDGGSGTWNAVHPGGPTASGHAGASAACTLQWNDAGDWSVTIGAEPPITGGTLPDVTGGSVLVYVPAAAPSITAGEVVTDCDPLVV